MTSQTCGPTSAAAMLELDDLIAESDFAERHERFVAAPISAVWPAVLRITEGEVRALRPLVLLRALFSRDTGPTGSRDRTVLAMLEADGFLTVRVDDCARRSGSMVSCAAGRFWSRGDDSAHPFAGLDEWRAFAEPGNVKLAWSIVATSTSGGTIVVTETRVVATDSAARRTFGRYWLLIRGPSGLIRRSLLAAIARRATATGSTPR